ncbi:MAG: DNA-binding protein [Microgenomates group bacterium GW2011_GWD1_33_9]|nr:MAG: DNA-binding protein [Microgenomates group bacterium GW2011_GWD1_33_9]
MKLRLKGNFVWVKVSFLKRYHIRMVTEKDKKLGKSVRKYRKRAGLKQNQLAEMINLSDKYIQLIEAGERKPSLKTIYKIAKALNVKVNEIFPF